MSGNGLVTGKHCFFILSYSEEEDNGYAISLRNVMVRIMRIPTWILTRRDDKSMSRMREILFWMNEQMRRRLAFPQVTCCFGLAVALEDAFALVTMEIIMLHRTLAKTSSQFTYLCTYNVRYVHPHIQTEGAGRWLRFGGNMWQCLADLTHFLANFRTKEKNSVSWGKIANFVKNL